MSDLAAAFHTAQEAALKAYADFSTGSPLGSLSTVKILSVTPTNLRPPYVLIGEDQVVQDLAACDGGGELFSTVHVWARPEPPQTIYARTIAEAVTAALDTPFAITGHDIVDYEKTSERYLTDPDGSTHVVLTFRYLTASDA